MARKVLVEKDTCISCGICVNNLPDVFRFDDSGKAECYDNEAASEEQIQSDAIDICPVGCIYWG